MCYANFINPFENIILFMLLLMYLWKYTNKRNKYFPNMQYLLLSVKKNKNEEHRTPVISYLKIFSINEFINIISRMMKMYH